MVCCCLVLVVWWWRLFLHSCVFAVAVAPVCDVVFHLHRREPRGVEARALGLEERVTGRQRHRQLQLVKGVGLVDDALD